MLKLEIMKKQFKIQHHTRKKWLNSIEGDDTFSIFSIHSESRRFGALKSHSTHHFFGNACTKSGLLRFSPPYEKKMVK
jgi:hypothetical protein